MSNELLKKIISKPFKRELMLMVFVSILILTSIGCRKQTNEKSKNTQFKTDSTLLVSGSNKNDTVIYNKLKDGKKNGLWREYDENNQLAAEGFYENGKANGLMKWYFEGVLVAKGNMKNDKRDGIWKICDVHNKSNCIEAKFKDDKKVGIWKILHENGKLWKEQNWEEGKVISEKCWDENGNQIKCD